MSECRLKPVKLGWFLTFPADSQAGLVFFSQPELDEFINSCGLTMTEDFDLNRISECPQYWLDRARIFQPTF
jgi:hypothetical protein